MKLLFAGTFDPFTVGHANIVQRALSIADQVVIAVGVNESKTPMYSASQRVDAIRRYYQSNNNISVMSYTGLTADLVHVVGADALLRGVRSEKDFDMERTLADANRMVLGVETVLMVADPRFQHVSSSLCRELMHFGHSVQGLVIDTFNVK